MPTYDYQCDACGHAIEVFESMSAKPKRKCPECGKMKFKRLIGTGAAVIFKGSGFYETDYRSDSYKQSAEADKKSAEPKSESKSESKGEKKSETKADQPAKADAKPKKD